MIGATPFAMAHQDSLYDAFQRLRGSDCECAGIGLATVERIILRRNGKVRAESAAGEGAPFYAMLPDPDASPVATDPLQ